MEFHPQNSPYIQRLLSDKSCKDRLVWLALASGDCFSCAFKTLGFCDFFAVEKNCPSCPGALGLRHLTTIEGHRSSVASGVETEDSRGEPWEGLKGGSRDGGSF